MGFLRNLLLALGALATVEAGLRPPIELPWAVPALVLLPYLLATLSRRLGARGRWRTSAVLAAAIDWSAAAVEAIAVCGLGWAATAARALGAEPGLVAWPGPELLLALAPYGAAELCAIDARARASDLRPALRAGLRRFQARMLLSALGPLAVFVLASSAVGLHPTVHAWVEEVGIANAAFTGVLLLAFAAALPRLLCSAWETAPLPAGRQRAVLEETARRARFRCKEIRLWRTSHLMANAAVVGFLPRHRVVLFSDALLEELGPAELAAVFAHEIGHVTRRHVAIFATFALGFFLLASVALDRLAPESLAVELLLFAGAFVLWYLSFGYLSRRFELDADLASLETTGDAHALIRALEQVGGAHAREKDSWRHFSVGRRVRFLAAHVLDPRVGRRLRRRLAFWTAAGAVVLVLGVGLFALDLVRDLPQDRVVVDLRLGRFADARARGAALALEPRLRAALDVSAGVPEHARPAELAARARARRPPPAIRAARSRSATSPRSAARRRPPRRSACSSGGRRGISRARARPRKGSRSPPGRPRWAASPPAGPRAPPMG